MRNGRIVALKTRVEVGGSLTNQEQSEVLKDLLWANRQLLKARQADFVIEKKPGKKAKPGEAALRMAS